MDSSREPDYGATASGHARTGLTFSHNNPLWKFGVEVIADSKKSEKVPR